jgi:hypothetical protein
VLQGKDTIEITYNIFLQISICPGIKALWPGKEFIYLRNFFSLSNERGVVIVLGGFYGKEMRIAMAPDGEALCANEDSQRIDENQN